MAQEVQDDMVLRLGKSMEAGPVALVLPVYTHEIKESKNRDRDRDRDRDRERERGGVSGKSKSNDHDLIITELKPFPLTGGSRASEGKCGSHQSNKLMPDPHKRAYDVLRYDQKKQKNQKYQKYNANANQANTIDTDTADTNINANTGDIDINTAEVRKIFPEVDFSASEFSRERTVHLPLVFDQTKVRVGRGWRCGVLITHQMR